MNSYFPFFLFLLFLLLGSPFGIPSLNDVRDNGGPFRFADYVDRIDAAQGRNNATHSIFPIALYLFIILLILSKHCPNLSSYFPFFIFLLFLLLECDPVVPGTLGEINESIRALIARRGNT